jgi:hypothetical protein
MLKEENPSSFVKEGRALNLVLKPELFDSVWIVLAVLL